MYSTIFSPQYWLWYLNFVYQWIISTDQTPVCTDLIKVTQSTLGLWKLATCSRQFVGEWGVMPSAFFAKLPKCIPLIHLASLSIPQRSLIVSYNWYIYEKYYILTEHYYFKGYNLSILYSTRDPGNLQTCCICCKSHVASLKNNNSPTTCAVKHQLRCCTGAARK